MFQEISQIIHQEVTIKFGNHIIYLTMERNLKTRLKTYPLSNPLKSKIKWIRSKDIHLTLHLKRLTIMTIQSRIQHDKYSRTSI